MGTSQKESELFEEWRGSRTGFVSDGVVSETEYLNSHIKLCFVLKEVNDLDGGGWDLRAFIRDGARPQTWDNITRWINCIQNNQEDINWSELESISHDDRVETLRSICSMNLKKSPGTHTTVKASFDKAVEEDKQFIKKQYELYKPDLTICGGTGWALRHVLGLNQSEVFTTTRGIKWFLNTQNNPVIIYVHPEARVQNSLLTYGLIDAVREILDVTEKNNETQLNQL
jgi:hypothetical protein